ncbi:hypothetical protein FAM09_14485 [Niastella caeni]|uniref:Glycosyltransferase RgtA/B/C/D-like domain-containing protein n=1 Tax=Niastella caeni TaxID=2569763 RepID=A0A4S8HVR2_9BACT|nr:hypothetical protein [Niastella caeni]THU39700.1 hypothetical protein FAM09_14485 [Niastella caeni]
MTKLLSWFKRHKNNNSTGEPTPTFSHFLFKNTVNKRYLLIALAGILLQFVIFKICYPFPDFFSDSYTYINAAAHHHVISVRPIGYSRFLELIHLMTTSDTALIFIQYLVVQTGVLLLFFSVRYFFPLHKTISHVLFAIGVFNPLALYISNYVSSDALFVGLAIIWFTQLLWIINRPRWIQLLPLAGLLFLLFTLRFAALYLPAIALLALLFCACNWLFKLTGIAFTVLPIFIEIQRIRYITKKETGTAIFSAFGSWMSVNNVLHMYPYIKVQDADLPSADCKAFNRVVKQYFDTMPVSERPYPSLTFYYLWAGTAPLKTYHHSFQIQKKINGYFNAWHAVAPIYSQYSNRLIRQHPVAFAQYYLWPNVKWYGLPKLESLCIYNTGINTVDSTAIKWFKYKSDQVRSVNKTIQGTILQPMPYWFLLVNIAFCTLLVMVIARVKRYSLPFGLFRTLLLAGGFWIINFCFSIYAAPIVLRFQFFPMIVYSTFSLVLINILFTRRHHAVSQ